MLNSNNTSLEIKDLLQKLMAKQEAIELEQKRHLEVIFKIAREELTTAKSDDKKSKYENNIILAVRDLLHTTKTLPQAIVEQTREQITHSMKTAHSEMSKLIGKITIQLQDILKEIKVDPDDPKPIELRTEQNSKQILETNEKIIPLVVKIQQLLERLDPAISKMSRALS